MDFELNEDQKLLKDSAAQFTKSSPVTRMRKLRSHGSTGHGATSDHGNDPIGWEPSVWKQMADLGWLGLFYPEDIGGLGMTFFDLCLIVEELGKTLVPEPIIASVILAGGAVLHAGTKAQQKAILGPMIDGKTSLALAWAEKNGRYDAGHVKTTATLANGEYTLTGEKIWALNGHAADTLIVSAQTASAAGSGASGISLFAIPKSTPGLTLTGIKTMDGQRAANLRLEGVTVPASALLGEEGKGLEAIEAALDLAAAATCSEAVGIASTVLWMTVNYLNVRKQFGVAIGTFQVLQHKSVDMFVETELLKSTAILAAVKATETDLNERKRAISIAKAQLSLGGKLVVQHAVQLHGGIGITDEHDVGLYFKRMNVIASLFGDEEHHLARFASLPSFA